jgi:putative aldouronate transport system permease protein
MRLNLHTRKLQTQSLKREMVKNYQLYLMVLPSIVMIAIFQYVPMYGVQIAFKDFNARLGIWSSPWIGLTHIEKFIQSPYFFKLLWNTFIINVYSLAIGFPIPILVAVILNELEREVYKKFVQTVICIPHFISTVVMVGMIFLFTNESKGIINHFIAFLGGERIAFMAKQQWFRTIYVLSGVWQNMGWNSIIYIAALSGVDVQMHEAAIIDGAGRLKRIWHINLPTIKPTIVIMLLMSMGKMLSVGFEKIYLMQLPLNLEVSEVISTYTYKIAFEGGSFSYGAAIGLFLNVLNLILLVSFNRIARKMGDVSLW